MLMGYGHDSQEMLIISVDFILQSEAISEKQVM